MGDYPYREDVPRLTQSLSDTEVLALTLWGETRSESLDGIAAVGCVVRNRVADHGKRFGQSFRDVCLKPWQFSCWWEDGANTRAVRATAEQLAAGNAPAQLGESLWIATGIIDRAIRDRTRGATHYLTVELLRLQPPRWVGHMTHCVTIGAHAFFREN